MSVLEFLSSGGVASTGGDLAEGAQRAANQSMKQFSSAVRDAARGANVTPSSLAVLRATFLFVGQDAGETHFVFAEKAGGNQISYRDLAMHGRVPLGALVQEVEQEIGAVACALSLPNAPTEKQIAEQAKNYVEAFRQAAAQKKQQPAGSAVPANPAELLPFLDSFRKDHPAGKRTAFIMMSFADTPLHVSVVKAVRDVLGEHSIIGLRADDKEYSDELYSNIRTYMHGCDFGISIFERILQDDFNPNVSLETGYMLGLGKPVCLLKDATLKALQTDLVGKLYKRFNPQQVESSVRSELVKWLQDRGLARK